MPITEFAHLNGKSFVSSLDRDEQKSLGQFMTPPPIARFMAQRATTGIVADVISILEPASGAGVLAAAVVQELLHRDERPSRIELTLYEIDGRLKPYLRRLADRLRRSAKSLNVKLTCHIVIGDFLLSELSQSARPEFDICIANPPYFKLNKADLRAKAHAYAVYGQPNIYGLFQAACAGLVRPAGRWCFITPRSWLNGSYFAAVRRHLLHYLQIDAVHLFESRQAHFYEDAILQEAVIAWATAQPLHMAEITFSTSQGVLDLPNAELFAIPTASVIGTDEEMAIAIPIAAGANRESDDSGHVHDTLASLGLKVSTGPVVPFRSKEYILESSSRGSVPLLWMQHVKHAGISWPIQKKREHILSTAGSAWMLLRNTNYVVMRRFSPKEDARRVTAAPYLAGSLPGEFIGLENHLNYIHRPTGDLTRAETVGLSAFLNSSYVDAYFRAVAGSTQVNATELRKLRFPSLDSLRAIGDLLSDRPTLTEADRAVEQVLCLKMALSAV
ncbi:Modification methylase TaqI [Pseudomonas sp. 31 R 17]|nr:Modification methylase TaqI [Pseudomonas sp. 31 R 17]